MPETFAATLLAEHKDSQQRETRTWLPEERLVGSKRSAMIPLFQAIGRYECAVGLDKDEQQKERSAYLEQVVVGVDTVLQQLESTISLEITDLVRARNTLLDCGEWISACMQRTATGAPVYEGLRHALDSWRQNLNSDIVAVTIESMTSSVAQPLTSTIAEGSFQDRLTSASTRSASAQTAGSILAKFRNGCQ